MMQASGATTQRYVDSPCSPRRHQLLYKALGNLRESGSWKRRLQPSPRTRRPGNIRPGALCLIGDLRQRAHTRTRAHTHTHTHRAEAKCSPVQQRTDGSDQHAVLLDQVLGLHATLPHTANGVLRAAPCVLDLRGSQPATFTQNQPLRLACKHTPRKVTTQAQQLGGGSPGRVVGIAEPAGGARHSASRRR